MHIAGASVHELSGFISFQPFGMAIVQGIHVAGLPLLAVVGGFGCAGSAVVCMDGASPGGVVDITSGDEDINLVTPPDSPAAETAGDGNKDLDSAEFAPGVQAGGVLARAAVGVGSGGRRVRRRPVATAKSTPTREYTFGTKLAAI